MDFYSEVGENETDNGVYFVPKAEIEARGTRHRFLSKYFTQITIGVFALVACVGVLLFVFVALPRLRVEDKPAEHVTKTSVQETPKAEESQEAQPAVSEVPAEEPATPDVWDIIQLPVSIPDFDRDGSRIPVQVEGVRADGSRLEERMYIYYDGSGMDLPAGTYTVRVTMTPIASSGMLYYYPETQVNIVVPEDHATQLIIEGDTFEFWPRDSSDVSNEFIASARDAIASDPVMSERADDFAARARERYLGE